MAQASDHYVLDFGAHINLNTGTNPMWELIEGQVGAPIHEDPEALRQLYDDAGIDGAVLSQSNYIGNADVDATIKANDDLLDILADYEDFYGLAALPADGTGETAAEEFERCIDAGYHGAAVEHYHGGLELVDEEMDPVLDVANRTGAPVLVHPVINDSLHPEVLDDTWQLNAIWGREVAMCESISKVIHEGVLDRYPNLNLVYHHTGGNIASMLGRIELQLEEDRWPGSNDLKSFDEFRTQLEERIYMDSSGYYGDPTVFRRALERFPSSQFMYGTDCPYETRTPGVFRKLVDSIEGVCSRTDARNVLGENALNLLVNVD